MIRRLWRVFRGYVVVKVKGTRLEGFLNRMAAAGIAVWDAERLSNGMLIARMCASGFKRTRHLSRRQGWQVFVVDRVGLPFLLARMARRKVLAIGAVAALVSLYVASGYIWFVQVDAEVEMPVERILAVASDAGLKPGVRSDGFDPQEIQLALLLKLDELAWAAVNVKGTMAVIEVAERSRPSDALIRPGDIVAERDGVIEKIAVSQGHPLVRSGDTVRKGDILISGFIPPEDPNHRRLVESGKAPYVRADGIVTARTWYEGTSRVRLTAIDERPTGRTSWRVELSHGERRFELGKGAAPFDQFDASERLWEIPTFGGGPITVSITRYSEVHMSRSNLRESEARQLAEEAALAELEVRLPEEATVLEGPYVEVDTVERESGVVLEATAYAEIINDIRAYRTYP